MANPTRSKRMSPEQRRTAVLQAAASVFFEQGYSASRIDTIIEQVGGSKRDIYKEFGSKEGLFAALVEEYADIALDPLSIEINGEHDLEKCLTLFANRLVDAYMSPALIGILRTVMAESSRFPDLARSFYYQGPKRAVDRLTEILEKATERGEVNLENCHLAADSFVGMLRDNEHMKVVLGLNERPANEYFSHKATMAVKIFLNGIKTSK